MLATAPTDADNVLGDRYKVVAVLFSRLTERASATTVQRTVGGKCYITSQFYNLHASQTYGDEIHGEYMGRACSMQG